MEILLSKYNNNECILDVVENPFTPGQSKYHIKWTFNFNGNEQFFEYELTPSTGSNNIPAVRVGYILNMDTPTVMMWHSIITAPECRAIMDISLGASGGTDLGVSSAELIDSGGNIGVTMDNWASPGLLQFIGTVAECNSRVTIDADFPIFLGELALYTGYMATKVGDAYYNTEIAQDNANIVNCVSGDMSSITSARNYVTTADTIPRNKIYYINNRLKKNGTIVETKRNEFQIAPGARIWLVAPQHSTTGQSYNMTLYMQGTGVTFKHRTPGNPWTVKHLLTPTLSKYYYGEWTDYGNGDFYNTINNTNIPIFADTDMGDRYGDGLIGEDFALNAGELESRRATTGDDLESTDIPNITVRASGIGCNVWALDRGNINSIMSILFDDDQTIIDDIKKGTWLWGNNPADFIISCYFVPFAITNFYDTTTERLYLGFYDTNHDYTRVKETKSSGQRITLVNTTIDSVYGDWRDYTNFKYEIYLPYVGFYPLDVMSYLNKTLTVEMGFDIMTHNIRYYLFANGKIVDRVDGSVGYDIPLMATDQVNKAKSDLAGITNVVKGGIGMVSGGMTMSQGYSTAGTLPGGGGADDTLIAQGRAGVIGGAFDAIKGIGQMMQYPKQEIIGNISSSMNIYDINYCYLKITEKDTLKPDQLNTLYNYPSYFMGNVSELSGYTEIVDIRFSCTGTENEINEIFSLLRNGVIL